MPPVPVPDNISVVCCVAATRTSNGTPSLLAVPLTSPAIKTGAVVCCTSGTITPVVAIVDIATPVVTVGKEGNVPTPSGAASATISYEPWATGQNVKLPLASLTVA